MDMQVIDSISKSLAKKLFAFRKLNQLQSSKAKNRREFETVFVIVKPKHVQNMGLWKQDQLSKMLFAT